MLPQPGTWKAKTARGVVYETEGGALMVAFDFGVDAETSIVGRVCLVKKDGEVLQNNVRNLKEAFGWDGTDPFWLADTDHSDREVEIVVEMETDQNGTARPTVKWINAPGRGGGLGAIRPADRNSVLAKYGMKFRALSGGTPVRTAPAKAPVATPAPAAPPARQAPPVVAAPPATVQDAWGVFCKAAGDQDDKALEEMWYKALAELVQGKDQSRFTPEDWGLVVAGVSAWVGNQIPM